MIRIYIPTLNRVGKQTTYHNLPPALQKNTVLVVPKDEATAHGVPTWVCPVRGIGKTRQWIVDNHPVEQHGPHILMLDDDLTFFTRRKDDVKKFTNATPQDLQDMMRRLEQVMKKGIAHGGIRHREMAQESDLYETSTRALRALAYNVEVLRKEGVRFDRIAVMEDFDVTLQLLRKGYPNMVLSEWIQNQAGSNLAGGCSTYRTNVVQAAGAHGLAKLHTPYVQVVTKVTKAAWGGGERTDVRISWKKAFASSGGGKSA